VSTGLFGAVKFFEPIFLFQESSMEPLISYGNSFYVEVYQSCQNKCYGLFSEEEGWRIPGVIG